MADTLYTDLRKKLKEKGIDKTPECGNVMSRDLITIIS